MGSVRKHRGVSTSPDSQASADWPLLSCTLGGQGPGGNPSLLGSQDPDHRWWGGDVRLPQDVRQLRGWRNRVLVILLGLLLQFEARRYRAFAYWSLAYAIAITGTGVSDFLHLDVHISYAGTTILWAVSGRDLLALAAQRGHLVDPQHHDPATRGLLLGDGLCDVRPRDRTRRLHRDLAQPRLPGLGPAVRRSYRDPGPGTMAVRAERHRRVLDVLCHHPAARGVLRGLHQQAPQPQRDQPARRRRSIDRCLSVQALRRCAPIRRRPPVRRNAAAGDRPGPERSRPIRAARTGGRPEWAGHSFGKRDSWPAG